MNRRDFAHLLALSGAVPFGWGEEVLNSAIPSVAAHSSDSTTSLFVPPLKPGRRIEGASAVLLPFTVRDEVDWSSFGGLLDRTWAAGV
jgi:hypothetical protein